MLKQRVITALILAGALLLAVFYAPLPWFAGLAWLVFAVASWEWGRLLQFSQIGRWLVALAALGLMAAVGWWMGLGVAEASAPLPSEPVLWLVGAAAGWWLLAMVLVKLYPQGVVVWGGLLPLSLMGVLVLVPTWASLVYLRAEPGGAWLICILLVSVVCADTGAYFVGRRWGRHKLAPTVSPGKSIEGFGGGFVCSLLFALLLTVSLGRPQDWWLLVLILPASLVSVLGDLLESMLKRHCGIKDSGRILPGHGGLLDRMDSVTAAAPIFVLAYILSGWQL